MNYWLVFGRWQIIKVYIRVCTAELANQDSLCFSPIDQAWLLSAFVNICPTRKSNTDSVLSLPPYCALGWLSSFILFLTHFVSIYSIKGHSFPSSPLFLPPKRLNCENAEKALRSIAGRWMIDVLGFQPIGTAHSQLLLQMHRINFPWSVRDTHTSEQNMFASDQKSEHIWTCSHLNKTRSAISTLAHCPNLHLGAPSIRRGSRFCVCVCGFILHLFSETEALWILLKKSIQILAKFAKQRNSLPKFKAMERKQKNKKWK